MFRRPKLVVFVDGCFWHSCPDRGSHPASRQEWWAAKLDRTVQRDRETNEALRAAGWTVLRIWEHEDPEEAAQRVVSTLARVRLRRDVDRTDATDPH